MTRAAASANQRCQARARPAQGGARGMRPSRKTRRSDLWGLISVVAAHPQQPDATARRTRRGRPGAVRPRPDPAPGADLVLDDVHLHDLSTKGSPSESELCNRICGHLSTHHDGGLSVFIANQVWTAVPPSIRKLCSHFALFPNRIARDSIGHIARGVLMTKQQLEACCDMCTGQYDWLLITNEPDDRARVRINGVHPVPGIL